MVVFFNSGIIQLESRWCSRLGSVSPGFQSLLPMQLTDLNPSQSYGDEKMEEAGTIGCLNFHFLQIINVFRALSNVLGYIDRTMLEIIQSWSGPYAGSA